MIPITIMTISLLLDGFLTNILSYLPNNLSLFTPSLTLVSIFLIYPFYRKNISNYYITIFILGFIYDLFYTNLLFYNAIIFLIIGFLIRFIYKNLEISIIRNIIYLAIIITLYEFIYGGVIFILHLVPITFNKILYKVSHTLLLNIIYGEIIYIILKIIPEKYKKISIN